MTKQADLILHLFEGHPGALGDSLVEWMEHSSRFTTFVETYQDKIRKKIRVSREPGSLLDVSSELEVARCLLQDRRLAVAYEPYASGKRRGPDFAVTYRANTLFNVEVSRLRFEERVLAPIDLARKEERIVRILLGKLGQMQPSIPNLLVIHTGGELARSVDMVRLMQQVKARAEGKDMSFYAGSAYANPSAFYKDFLRLTGILLWGAGAQLWINKQARTGLSDKVLRLVSSLLSGESPA